MGLLPDGAAVDQEWRRIIVQYPVSGVQLHDAHLVAAMRVHGVGHKLTLNVSDFSRYSGITVLHLGSVLRRAALLTHGLPIQSSPAAFSTVSNWVISTGSFGEGAVMVSSPRMAFTKSCRQRERDGSCTGAS